MGSLTEFLGEKVTLLQGLVGEKLGMMAQMSIMLITTVPRPRYPPFPFPS